MYAAVEFREEEDLGYDVAARALVAPRRDRRALNASRIRTGKERAAQQARYSRRASPTRMSSAAQRHQRVYGL